MCGWFKPTDIAMQVVPMKHCLSMRLSIIKSLDISMFTSSSICVKRLSVLKGYRVGIRIRIAIKYTIRLYNNCIV